MTLEPLHSPELPIFRVLLCEREISLFYFGLFQPLLFCCCFLLHEADTFILTDIVPERVTSDEI